jgi:cell division inhibitor SepF
LAKEITIGGNKMASKLLKPFNKMMGAIGLVDEEEPAEYEDINEEEDEYQEPEIVTSKKNKIVSIKTSTSPKVLLKKPQEFQDILELVDAIKTRKIVVMNIVEVEPRLAQRMIDYCVGACYALNGAFQEIAKSIYLIAPENVEITNELKQVLNKNGFFSFGDKA